jgi:hypothetical protein
LAQLSKASLSGCHDLFENIVLLGDVIGLSKAERAILTFSVMQASIGRMG